MSPWVIDSRRPSDIGSIVVMCSVSSFFCAVKGEQRRQDRDAERAAELSRQIEHAGAP
jgi:hypothetical protein